MEKGIFNLIKIFNDINYYVFVISNQSVLEEDITKHLM